MLCVWECFLSQKLTSPVKLTWYNGTADSTYNGVMATLHFAVSESAAADTEIALQLIIDANNVCNMKEENVPFETVEACLDTNGDGKVNMKDLIRLTQYLADEDVEIFP